MISLSAEVWSLTVETLLNSNFIAQYLLGVENIFVHKILL